MLRPILTPNPCVRGGLVLIEPTASEVFERHRQVDPQKPEAGGILLGYRRAKHLHVIEATSPLLGDKRNRFFFERTALPHRAYALKRWRGSNQTIDYVGEWHTHPEDHPSPSSVDVLAWRSIHFARNEPMLFVIAGTGRYAWLGIGFRSKLWPMGIHTMDPHLQPQRGDARGF